MTLAQRCKQGFGATTRSKGDAYYRQGLVKILNLGEDRVEAAVAGSGANRYSVVCDWSESRHSVTATCTCPHYDDGNFCKHLWATLRAIDDYNPDILAGRERIQLAHEHDGEHGDGDDEFGDDNEGDEFDEYDDDFADERRQSGHTESRLGMFATSIRSQLSHASKKKNKEPWHVELASLPMAAGGPTHDANRLRRTNGRPRRARFVVDIAASFRAGAIVINLFQRELRIDGQWGKIKPLKVKRDELHSFSPDDRRRLGLALGNYTGVPLSYGSPVPLHFQSYQQVSQVELVPEVHELLLSELCADNCLGWVLGSDQSAEEARPLAWDNGEPWRFRVALDDDSKRRSWTVRGELVRGEQIVPLAAPVLLLSSGVILFQDRIARLTTLGDVGRAVVDSASDRVLVRDRTAEDALIARLDELRIGASKPAYYVKETGDVEFPASQLGEIVEQLTADGWLVQAAGRLIKRAGAFRATIASDVDWFDLETEIDFDGAAAVARRAAEQRTLHQARRRLAGHLAASVARSLRADR